MSCRPLKSSIVYIPFDTSQVNEQVINVSQFDSIWIPKAIAIGGVPVSNTSPVILVRLTANGTQIPMSLTDGWANFIRGVFDKIYVTAAADTGLVYLACGCNLNVGYCNADGLSPEVGGGLPGYSSRDAGAGATQ